MLYFKKARSGAALEILEQGGGTQCRKERHSAAFLSPRALYFLRTVCYGITVHGLPTIFMAIPHNSKCRYGERGATAAKPKAQTLQRLFAQNSRFSQNVCPFGRRVCHTCIQKGPCLTAEGFCTQYRKLFLYFFASLSGKMILLTKKKISIKMSPLSIVVPML